MKDNDAPGSNCCVKKAATGSRSSSVTPLARLPLHPSPLKVPASVQSSYPLTALPPSKLNAESETVLESPSEFVKPKTSVWVPDNDEVSRVTRNESALAVAARHRNDIASGASLMGFMAASYLEPGPASTRVP
jgi:hypothetical protein